MQNRRNTDRTGLIIGAVFVAVVAGLIFYDRSAPQETIEEGTFPDRSLSVPPTSDSGTRQRLFEAQKALREKLYEIERVISLMEGNLATARLESDRSALHAAKVAEKETEIEEQKDRREWLRRQLDYIEIYGELPPESFFKTDGADR